MKERIKKYFLPVFLTTLLFIVLGFEIYLLQIPPEQVPTRFIIVSLFVINIVAIVTLAFFVIRSIFRLIIEKHREVPGYRFRTKIVTIFVGLVLIPSVLLFVAFSGVLEHSVERIFSKSNREIVSKSVNSVKAFYDFEKARLLGMLEHFAEGKLKDLPGDIRIEHIQKPEPDMPQSLQEAFQGKKSAQVLTYNGKDIIIAAVPYKNGILVAKMELPSELSKKVEELKGFHEEYLKMGSFRKAVKTNYYYFLGFLSLIVIFLALWTSMKISQEITKPLKELVEATNRAAKGDLKVKILTKSSDEIGILVNSFNEMIEKLDKAYIQLSERKIILEQILSNISSGVIFMNPDGKILTINSAAEEILQIEREQFENKHYSELLNSIESDELKEFIANLSEQKIYEVKKVITGKIKGQSKIVNAKIISIRDITTDRASGILVVFDDITEIVKAQQAIAWEEVARRLAHEIKNPLTPIKLATERLIKKWKNKDEDFEKIFERSTKTIISEVDSLKNLIESFQKFGRLPEIKKKSINPLKLIDDVIELYRGYKDIKFSFNKPEEIREVELDPDEFKRVIINIVDNAIKAMDGKGEVTISVKLNNKLVVEICDTGPGIDEETREKLFLPYFSKSKGGTGLGLAIARKIITEHGGNIKVSENEHRGTKFIIEVPA
ncbi:sensor histidine kinase [Thermodesulfovibrio hydrogeniphilus]